MTDRLTEIKARDEVDAPYLSLDTIEGEALRDRRVLLAEIERAHRERDLFYASVNEIGAERDALRAEVGRLTPTDWCDKHVATAGCPGCIEEEYRGLRDLLEKAIHLVEGMRVFGNDNLQRFDVPPWLKAARAALEESK